MKKNLILLLLSIFLTNNITFATGDVFQGHAEFSEEFSGLDKELYT